jgi:hypothetical protein
MWTSFKRYDARYVTAISRLRLIGLGGCLSSAWALACTPMHDLNSYTTGTSPALPAADDGATTGPGDASDAAAPTSDDGLPSDETSDDATWDDGAPGDGSAELPWAGPVEGPSSSSLLPDAAVDPAPVVAPAPLPTSIVSSIPADGALGVSPDVVLVVTFGRAMDAATVLRALASDDIPLDGATFTWNADNSVVQITLGQPLTVASASDPAQLAAAICYSYRISEEALDAAGQAVIPASVSFCTARRITRTHAPVSDPGLTGNFRSDGSYGDGACASGANAVCVGDSGFAANSTYRGFLTFDLSGVPESILAVDAELRLERASVNGAPFDELGTLLVEPTRFTRIDGAAFREGSASALGAMRPIGDDAPTLSGEVEPLLTEFENERVQLRLRFADDTDQDGQSDHIVAPLNGVTIRLNYLVP